MSWAPGPHVTLAEVRYRLLAAIHSRSSLSSETFARFRDELRRLGLQIGDETAARILHARPASWLERRVARYVHCGDPKSGDIAYLHYLLLDQSHRPVLFFKPDYRDDRPTLPGVEAIREVVASQVGEALEFDGLVPTAAIKVVRLPDYGMRCAGSAHAFVRFDRLPSPLAQAYPDEWLDELAALHWIIGLTDWNLGSVGLATSGRRAGRPLSFDHASSWPRPPRPSVPPLPLMSHPVLAKGTTGFGRTVIDKVRALRPEVLYATVRARGIDDTAAVLGVTRLLSLQKHGRIVPTDYPGGIRGWTV